MIRSHWSHGATMWGKTAAQSRLHQQDTTRVVFAATAPETRLSRSRRHSL
jgi:hypothetical protein